MLDTALRALLVAAITVSGAAVALGFLSHSGWGWIGFGIVGGLGLLGEAVFQIASRQVARYPAGALGVLEWTAPVSPLAAAIWAAILVAWLGSEVLTVGGSKPQQKAWSIGTGGIIAGLSYVFVDSLKDGGINARRIRQSFRHAFEPKQDLPHKLGLSIMSPNQARNWATRAQRRERACEFSLFLSS
jgi:hypothetical protein